MLLFPAIDLYDGNAVRLIKGDFNKMTVYSDDPLEIAKNFRDSGAQYLHTVDLRGAKEGVLSCCDIIRSIVAETNLFVQTGGGIRSMDSVEALIDAGVSRIILGTAAVLDRNFLCECLKRYGNRTAVGADIKNGYIAVKGWSQLSDISAESFFENMENLGVETIICTDISKDGMMAGTNLELYEKLAGKYSLNIIASGGVTSYEDISKLNDIGVYGAILGKALYERSINLKDALKTARGETIDN